MYIYIYVYSCGIKITMLMVYLLKRLKKKTALATNSSRLTCSCNQVWPFTGAEADKFAGTWLCLAVGLWLVIDGYWWFMMVII